MIENLSRIKGVQNTPKKTVHITEAQADALIQNYQKQIAQSVQASQTQFMLSGAMPQAGSLFSVNA